MLNLGICILRSRMQDWGGMLEMPGREGRRNGEGDRGHGEKRKGKGERGEGEREREEGERRKEERGEVTGTQVPRGQIAWH